MSRRDFLRRSAGAAFAFSSAGALLSACGPAGPATSPSGSSFPLARPDHPATWPILKDNQPIADGLQPEHNTLQIFNWADYIYKKVAKEFGAQHGVDVQVSTFDNTDEFLAKIRTGQVQFDVTFPTPDLLGRLTAAKLLQPLNHSYLPNLSNVWPELQDPWYDRGSRYSIPYTIYTTGIAWRNDHVTQDLFQMPNPYEIFWDPEYKGKVYILDDYREAPGMALLKNGITDLNTGSAKDLDIAKQDLLKLIDLVNVKADVNDYTEIPEGRAWIHQAWSGDMVSAQFYLPKGTTIEQVSYWYPPEGGGAIGSDCIAIPRNAKNPVLAHMFLNYMLDSKVAYDNFVNFVGYQPPQNDINPDRLVGDGAVPKNLTSTVVKPSDFSKGYILAELSPSVDAAWHNAWQEFQAGA